MAMGNGPSGAPRMWDCLFKGLQMANQARLVSIALLVMLNVQPSMAQRTVVLKGLAFDSVRNLPLSSAVIAVQGTSLTAVSDSAGRFRIEGVALGSFRLIMQHDALDARGMSAATARVEIVGDNQEVTIAVPSFATLWGVVCTGRPPEQRSGFIFGTIGRGGKHIADAVVVAKVPSSGKEIETRTDSLGNYSLCGLSLSDPLEIRASRDNTFSDWIAVPALGSQRIGRRDISIVRVGDATRVAEMATFSGRVTADSVNGINGAEVVVVGVGLKTTTNEGGDFRLAGVLPGTHTVQVRKVGYAASDALVEFRPGEITQRSLVLGRITTLDSVRVIAKTAPDEAMRLFGENRKIGLGRFLTRDDLEKKRDLRMSDILGQMTGMKAQTGSGGTGWMLPNRGTTQMNVSCVPLLQDNVGNFQAEERLKKRYPGNPPSTCVNACFPHVFLDGVDVSPTEVPNINRYSPTQLEAVEYYAGAAQVPPEYNRLNKSSCGVIVLHTKRGK